MKKLFTLLTALLLFIATDVAAKSYGSKSFGGGSKSSWGSSSKSYNSNSTSKSTSGWFSSKPKPAPAKPVATVKPTPTPATSAVKPTTTPATSTVKPVTTATTTKSTSGFTSAKTTPTTSTTSTTSKTALDQKLAKKNALLSQNNAAGKKYGTKASAETAYRSKMASSNKYTSSTPPATRPDYIPQTVSAGGRNVNVTYHALPGGGYGYGYMDPITHTFMTLTAAHMIADAAHMSRYGYGDYDAYGRPIYHQPYVAPAPVQHTVVHHKGTSGFVIFMWILFGCVVVGGILWFFLKED